MKLSIFFMFMLVLNTTANSLAQKTMTISASQMTLREIFIEIKKQTGYTVVYNNQKLDINRPLNVHFNNAGIQDVLNKILANTGLTYELMDDFVILSSAPSSQQENIKIYGKVTDEYKNPLPGATVLVKEGSVMLGATTSIEGTYKLTIPAALKKFSISFSFMGMETKVVEYKGRDTINVVLHEDAKEMDEVVVTGYQTLKKRSMAGSISTVKAEDLLLNGTQSLEQALQGQIPGMIVMNQSGLTGTRQRVRVRGTSTLLGNAEPVWVVDGIVQDDPLPFDSNEFSNQNTEDSDMIREFVGGAISWLNPNDIESITVLKDASSTAIYGVKAANGVIVITTKKGEKGRMSVSYNGNFSLTPRLNYKKMELMNSQQRVEVSREAYQKKMVLGENSQIGYAALARAYMNREISLETFTAEAKKLEMYNTDWFDILFHNAFSHNHSIGFSGGSDKATYRASFGYNTTNNTAKGNSQTAYTINLNVSATPWKNLSITAGLAGSVTKTKAFAGNDPFEYASSTNRAIGCFDEEGERMFYQHSNGYLFNVLNELEQSGNENTKNTLNSTLNIRWRLTDWLTYQSNFSYNTASANGFTYYTEQSNHIAQKRKYNFDEFNVGSKEYENSELPYGGEYNTNQNSNANLTWRNQFDFMKIFKDVHSLTVMIGQEIRSTKTDGFRLKSYGYLHDKGKLFLKLPKLIAMKENSLIGEQPTITDTEQNYISFFSTLDYSYDNRYSINASIRADASNRFGQDKSTRFLPVWSVGVRWNVGSEHWLEGQDILSDMSLRASYGFQGNVAENVSPDLIATMKVLDNRDYVLQVKDLPAPYLKWEKVGNLNLGVDFSFFKNKVRGVFEYYYKKTRDMVVDQVIPYANGVSSRPVNGGTMSNKGWDAQVSFNPIQTKDLLVTLSLNFGKVYNEIKSILKPNGSWQEAVSGNLNKIGYPVSSFWAFRFSGLNPEHGGPEFDLSGSELDEASHDATLYMDYAGKKDPDFTTNLSLTIRYKTFSLSSSFYLSVGNQQFLAPISKNMTSIPNEYENMSTEWLKRWRKPGDEKHTNVPALPDRSTTAQDIKILGRIESSAINTNRLQPYELYANSTARVVDAWFLRCQNISFSYSLPSEKLPGFLQNLSFTGSVSNPFQIRSKDFLGRDPEVALGNQPMSSIYTLGINMSF